MSLLFSSEMATTNLQNFSNSSHSPMHCTDSGSSLASAVPVALGPES